MAIAPVPSGLKPQYLLDNDWQDARRRLALLEDWLDPGTIHHLHTLGVQAGWRCLVVGGGGGSITEWLCRQVGPSGHVVATDINTRFLEALDYPNLEVRRHDILADELEPAAFDLVHVRFVLMHLADAGRAVRRMVAALKPGGWLLAEEGDSTSLAPHLASDSADGRLFGHFRAACGAALAAAGGNFQYGRQLYADVCAAGLAEVAAEGRVHVVRGGSPPARLWRLTAGQLRDGLLRVGGLTAQQVAATERLLDDPAFVFSNLTVWAVRGQQP